MSLLIRWLSLSNWYHQTSAWSTRYNNLIWNFFNQAMFLYGKSEHKNLDLKDRSIFSMRHIRQPTSESDTRCSNMRILNETCHIKNYSSALDRSSATLQWLKGFLLIFGFINTGDAPCYQWFKSAHVQTWCWYEWGVPPQAPR